MTSATWTNVTARFVATAGGAGYSPIAPGTCGTAVAVPLAYAAATLPLWGFALITVATTIIGIWAADVSDAHWGTHDSGRIVIDEVAGYFVTLLAIDRTDWTLLLLGFVAFRLFDIVKPPPVRWIDKNVPGGAGVVLDDIGAGVLACAALYGLSLTVIPDKLASLI
jgi:phosphatidylglycerophosphatase A